MHQKIGLEKPMEIEKKSFSIIERHLQHVSLPEAEYSILKRVIHTTADFDYVENLTFSKGAVSIALKALQNGADIVTDTNMAYAGIHKSALQTLGGTVHCFMSDADVAKAAKERGVTRAMVSMEKACTLQKELIFAIGNAPTALIRLTELIKEQKIQPKLIIGVPVGFVNVIEAKNMILEGSTPYIVAKGNKGGSNVAAAICNALLYQLITRD
ncbi:MAG: precorrin-8X methylmutase [Oscillospiraceae bacterium]|nr:precorrin-8X methylmutase [Oscillospiraceae bacterium]MDD7295516.1 precorrin-8X methylmutase [Oscillospiraceae bacterium]MDY2510006.1 precorrin-8X methylmutase [Ruminococcus callidus]